MSLLTTQSSGGESRRIVINEPSADRWMYPANSTPGFRPQASTFSALPALGGDGDRFGQYIFRFDTEAAGIPMNLESSSYSISHLKITARISQDLLFAYDPTEDSWITYLPGGTADGDPGRPLELHGTGFRNGFTARSFIENSAYSGGNPRSKNAYAYGYSSNGEGRDVSNNISEGFDSLPWAIGRMDQIPTGSLVPIDQRVEFEVNLQLPGVRKYVTDSLNQGFIWFTLSSLHSALQQGGEFAAYYTKDSQEHILFGDSATSIEITYSLPSEEPPNFTHFQRNSENQVSLSFRAIPGFAYTLQSSQSMESSSWKSEQVFTTSVPRSIEWNELRNESNLFFRILRTVN